MEFIKKNKKNIICYCIFIIGIYVIYMSVKWGQSYYLNFVVKNHLLNSGGLEVLLGASIFRYIIIGILISIFAIKNNMALDR